MKKRALLCLLALMLCLPMTTMAVDASEAYSSPVDIAADMLIQLDRDSFSTASTLEDKHSVAYEAAYLLADVGALDETSWSEVLVKINELTGGEPLPLAEYLCQNEGILDDVRLIEAVAFSDIADDAWYADYVNTAAYLGLVNGRGDGLFVPDGTMTYAEAVTLAARLDAFLHERDLELGEADPQGKVWYTVYVDYARRQGLPCDYEDYKANITRSEFAHIFDAVYRNAKAMYDEKNIIAINDVPDGSIPDMPMTAEHAQDVYELYRLGILSGSDGQHSFLPGSSIKRSEVCAIVCRLLDIDRVSFSMN